MKAKRIWTGAAIALAVAIGLGLPEAASADRGGGSRGGGGRAWAGHVKGGGFHGHPRTVFAGHRHFRSSVGVVVGVPLFWGAPWYPYYPPYYYPPYGYPGYGYYPPAVVSTSPPVYVEKGAQEGVPGGSDYWYYCEQSQTYYPYVKECPGGWKRVVPQPPEQ